jgi:hypothetical protein
MADRDDLLRPFLAGRDEPCPACGYNLRDLGTSTCPECGEALALRVGLAEPKQAAVLAGLIGLTAGAGMSALLLLYLVLRVFVFGDRYYLFRGTFMVLNAGGFAAEGLATVWWLRNWRKIRRLGPRPRRLLVAGCWLLTLANLILFTANVR